MIGLLTRALSGGEAVFRFLDPWIFLALVAIPLVVAFYFLIERQGRARIVFSDISSFKGLPPSPRVRLRHLGIGLRCLVLALLVAALARPQSGNQTREIMSKGIDIMIVLDVSGSMKATDMDPNRLAAAKQVVNAFIDGREAGLQNDRIGLVAFSRIALTRCPLTVDYTILKKIVDAAVFARKEFDGTAIGEAISTAVLRMRDSEAKSKVLILVTDGENNVGRDPMEAAAIAKVMDVRIYTIGVVPETLMDRIQDKIFGDRLVPSMRPPVDERQMEAIAESTGGKYFRAKNREGLAAVFKEIDELEKTEVKVKEFYRYSERFTPLLVFAFLFLLAEVVLSRTLLRRLP